MKPRLRHDLSLSLRMKKSKNSKIFKKLDTQKIPFLIIWVEMDAML